MCGRGVKVCFSYEVLGLMGSCLGCLRVRIKHGEGGYHEPHAFRCVGVEEARKAVKVCSSHWVK